MKYIMIKEIDWLKKCQSPWSNKIYHRILKECSGGVCRPLVNIFRKSVDSGEVPTTRRQTNIILIFKRGDRSFMSNYCSVCLTSVVG